MIPVGFTYLVPQHGVCKVISRKPVGGGPGYLSDKTISMIYTFEDSNGDKFNHCFDDPAPNPMPSSPPNIWC